MSHAAEPPPTSSSLRAPLRSMAWPSVRAVNVESECIASQYTASSRGSAPSNSELCRSHPFGRSTPVERSNLARRAGRAVAGHHRTSCPVWPKVAGVSFWSLVVAPGSELLCESWRGNRLADAEDCSASQRALSVSDSLEAELDRRSE